MVNTNEIGLFVFYEETESFKKMASVNFDEWYMSLEKAGKRSIRRSLNRFTSYRPQMVIKLMQYSGYDLGIYDWDSSNEKHEIETWCITNCAGRTHNKWIVWWLFELKEDAMLFKLTWL
jgi:hypothetical protein